MNKWKAVIAVLALAILLPTIKSQNEELLKDKELTYSHRETLVKLIQENQSLRQEINRLNKEINELKKESLLYYQSTDTAKLQYLQIRLENLEQMITSLGKNTGENNTKIHLAPAVNGIAQIITNSFSEKTTNKLEFTRANDPVEIKPRFSNSQLLIEISFASIVNLVKEKNSVGVYQICEIVNGQEIPIPQLDSRLATLLSSHGAGHQTTGIIRAIISSNSNNKRVFVLRHAIEGRIPFDLQTRNIITTITEIYDVENTSVDYRTATCKEVTYAQLDKFTEVKDLELKLTSGTWIIGYDITAVLWCENATSNVAGSVVLCDNMGTYLPNSMSYCSHNLGTVCSSVSRQTIVEILQGQEKTIKVCIRQYPVPATATTRFSVVANTVTSSGPTLQNDSTLWALRIK